MQAVEAYKTLYVTILAMKKRDTIMLGQKMLKENPPKDDKKKDDKKSDKDKKEDKRTTRKTAKRQ
jgi:hypothetical protein